MQGGFSLTPSFWPGITSPSPPFHLASLTLWPPLLGIWPGRPQDPPPVQPHGPVGMRHSGSEFGGSYLGHCTFGQPQINIILGEPWSWGFDGLAIDEDGQHSQEDCNRQSPKLPLRQQWCCHLQLPFLCHLETRSSKQKQKGQNDYKGFLFFFCKPERWEE